MVRRSTFRQELGKELDSAGITSDGNPVSIEPSGGDRDVTESQAPFITLKPIEKTDLLNRFGDDDYEAQTITQQIYVYAPDSFDLDDVTEQVLDNLPNRVEDAHKEEVTVTHALSPAQDVKMHSNTISAMYERK